MEEGSAQADYQRVVALFANGSDLNFVEQTIRGRLEKVPQNSAASHGCAIAEGTFLAVIRRVNENVDVQEAFDEILGHYSSILAEYFNYKPAQIRLIDQLEQKSLEPGSPFLVVFGGMIQTLRGHFMTDEAINEWKATRQAQEANGNLGPGAVNLLRQIEAIPLMMNLQPLEQLNPNYQIAHDMGF